MVLVFQCSCPEQQFIRVQGLPAPKSSLLGLGEDSIRMEVDLWSRRGSPLWPHRVQKASSSLSPSVTPSINTRG